MSHGRNEEEAEDVREASAADDGLLGSLPADPGRRASAARAATGSRDGDGIRPRRGRGRDGRRPLRAKADRDEGGVGGQGRPAAQAGGRKRARPRGPRAARRRSRRRAAPPSRTPDHRPEPPAAQNRMVATAGVQAAGELAQIGARFGGQLLSAPAGPRSPCTVSTRTLPRGRSASVAARRIIAGSAAANGGTNAAAGCRGGESAACQRP